MERQFSLTGGNISSFVGCLSRETSRRQAARVRRHGAETYSRLAGEETISEKEESRYHRSALFAGNESETVTFFVLPRIFPPTFTISFFSNGDFSTHFVICQLSWLGLDISNIESDKSTVTIV